MTPTTATPAVTLGGTSLTLGDLLRREHQGGRLLPWLRRAAREAFLLDQARALGLEADPADLQRAADEFRRRLGLLSAADTDAWLQRRRLSVDDLEAALRSRLLLAMLKARVAGPEWAAERFEAKPADYDRLSLVLALLPREDLAREVLAQVREEGADLGEAARRHSLHPSRDAGGKVGPVFRCQLPRGVRDALDAAKPGAVAGPVAAGGGFTLARIDQSAPAQLDGPTAAFLTRAVFDEWVLAKLAEAPFAAPLLASLA